MAITAGRLTALTCQGRRPPGGRHGSRSRGARPTSPPRGRCSRRPIVPSPSGRVVTRSHRPAEASDRRCWAGRLDSAEPSRWRCCGSDLVTGSRPAAARRAGARRSRGPRDYDPRTATTRCRPSRNTASSTWRSGDEGGRAADGRSAGTSCLGTQRMRKWFRAFARDRTDRRQPPAAVQISRSQDLSGEHPNAA